MYNLQRTHGTLLEKQVATGFSIDREGVCLIKVMEGGIAKVKKSTGGSAGAGVFVGFAVSDNESIASEPRVESAVIPATGPFAVQLSSTTPFSYTGGTTSTTFEVAVYDTNTAAWLVNTSAGAPSTTQFVLSAAGMLYVNTGTAAHTLTVYWRVNLTVAEAKMKYYERNINNTAGVTLGQVGVMCGACEFYTYEYENNINWAATTGGNAYCGSDGRVTGSPSGSQVCGSVIKTPTSDDASLGIAFNVMAI